MGSAALMGASGFMTVIYAVTKINYSYEIPLLMLITLRGAMGDHHKHHASNGLYLEPVLHAIDLPYTIVLEIEAFSPEEQRLQQPPLDGPELKYRFDRNVERITGADVFGYTF